MISCNISCIYDKSLVVLLKTGPLHRFSLQFAIRLAVPYGETRYSYKIDNSCYLPSTEGTVFVVIYLYK